MALITTHPIGDSNPADADLTTRIAIALINRQRSGWRKIHLIVQHGFVTLAGEVSTADHRQLVVAITQHVAGVIRVEDELTVTARPTRKRDDSERQDSAGVRDEPAPEPDGRSNDFVRIPVLAESLEDILAAQERNAAVA